MTDLKQAPGNSVIGEDTGAACPSCNAAGMKVFYEFKGAPVHSVLLMPTREAALNYPKGDIALGFCGACGFISNTLYDPSLHEYSTLCEESQGYSEFYNSFAARLAEGLIEKYGIRGKEIVEIGCGKGEFLALLCELGGNRGVGFDPAFVSERIKGSALKDIRFITDFYSSRYSGCEGDLIVCKMTLEHIKDTSGLLKTIRSSITRRGTVLFFQVPDVTRVLYDLAFWDIYYEHCSYFSPGSLSRLFRASGFDVLDMKRDFGAQYIILEARPSDGDGAASPPALPLEDDLERISRGARYFTENCRQKTALWKQKLHEFSLAGYRTVLWGSGSKGVAFLTTLSITDEISYVVDINTRRHGTYMAGTGHEIVPPWFLKDYRPDAVIVMNPVYRDEVAVELERMGVEAELMTV